MDLGKEVAIGHFYDKLDDDLEEEIKGLSDLYECDNQNDKIDTLRELLPDWNWYHASCKVEDVEKSLKEKEAEQDDESESDIYNSWEEQKEKEDSQIDEMFSALRTFN